MSSSLCSVPADLRGEQRNATISSIALHHRCARHHLFEYLWDCRITTAQAAQLLRNYDAHATVLRRLLLKAAAIMPETAVGYILENVRNEYGNGDESNRHQLQLQQLAWKAGVNAAEFKRVQIRDGVRAYMRAVPNYYCPRKSQVPRGFYLPAIAAGAITATEILALEEFRAMQEAFRHKGLADDVWFDHVNVEAEHLDESVALAEHFCERYDARNAVDYGLHQVLEANCNLYDGLLEALLSV